MQPRMNNPALAIPGALKALHAVSTAVHDVGLPEVTVHMVHLRASQINGCSWCVDMHSRELKEAGEPDERIWGVAAWRESAYFSEPERAALALTEAVTRISDREDPVTDEIWEAAAKHYNEQELAALVLTIATINVWNRLNVATRQVVGANPG